MALYDEIAPNLSNFVSETAAKNFAENLLSATTPTYRTLADLSGSERSALFTWLKWFGQTRKPVDASPWINWSPGKVATELRMDKNYVISLINERNAIVSEVSTYGSNAFLPHDPPTITNVSLGGENVLDGYVDVFDGYVNEIVDGYSVSVPHYVSTPTYHFVPDGSFTITGTTFISYSNDETYVTFKRNATSVTKTKTQIEANGGSVTDTEIFVTSGTLPVQLQANDTVTIYANNLVSDEYTIL